MDKPLLNMDLSFYHELCCYMAQSSLRAGASEHGEMIFRRTVLGSSPRVQSRYNLFPPLDFLAYLKRTAAVDHPMLAPICVVGVRMFDSSNSNWDAYECLLIHLAAVFVA